MSEQIGLVRRGYSASGGAEAYLLRLAAGLRRRGAALTLYATADWPAERWPYGELVTIRDRSPRGFADDFQRVRRVGEVVLSLDRVPGADVFRAGDGVHAAWLYRRGLFEPAWRRALHLVNPKHLAAMRLECEVVQSARAVIANSEMVAEEIARWQEFPRERIRVVRNGIGASVPLIDKAEARRRLEIPESARCVLFVGSGWERKGLRFAVRAVDQLAGETLLLVAGRGKAGKFRSPRARFFGPVSDLSALFSAADVFTLPTIYDPFSNACLEALAAGLPVVTTTSNGCSEILDPDRHGTAVKVGDVDALAAALEHWLEADRTEAAAACRARAAEYSIDRNVAATLDILREVAGR